MVALPLIHVIYNVWCENVTRTYTLGNHCISIKPGLHITRIWHNYDIGRNRTISSKLKILVMPRHWYYLQFHNITLGLINESVQQVNGYHEWNSSDIFHANDMALYTFPNSKVHWVNMGPTCVRSAPVGPNVGPMNLALRVDAHTGIIIVHIFWS